MAENLDIAAFTKSIKTGQDLTQEESYNLFGNILSAEQINENEVSEFLIALKEKGECSEEILGAIKVLREMAGSIVVPDNFKHNLVDTCGTGGDGLNTLNVSTAVAFVVAGAGVPVAKHGNKSVSSRSGSADVLTHLGINIMAAKEQVESCLEQANMCFLMAPLYHNAMKNVAPIRAKLKTRTIFNLLGPLLNPAGVNRQLIGVYDKNLIPLYASVLNKLGAKKSWVVHGADGLDEVSISGESFVAEVSNGTTEQFEVAPIDFGVSKAPVESIKGGEPEQNALELKKLLQNASDLNQAYKDIVIANSASVLYLAEKVETPLQGADLARQTLESGAANNVLDKIIKISNA